MAINPGIALEIQQPHIFSPVEAQTQRLTLEQAQQLAQTRKQDFQIKQQEFQTHQQLRAIVQKHNGDLSAALPEISALDPASALTYQKEIDEANAHALNYKAASLGYRQKAAEFAAQHLGGAKTADDYARGLYILQQAGESVDAYPKVGEWTPDASESIKRNGLTAYQQVEEERKQLLAQIAALKADATKPKNLVSVAPGSTLYDPESKAPVFTAPEKTPTAKSLQAESVLLDGKPARVMFDPNGKMLDLNGQEITNAAARVKPIPAASLQVNAGNGTDAKSIADAIISGDQPPDTKGLYRLAAPVRAELARQGYDLTKAGLDWEATKKHLATLNGAQQTRLRQAISTATDSLDVIERLSDQWKGGRFPLLNKANLLAAKNGVYGKEAASIATQLEGQITDVTSELGNVYMGGNSPTDHALQLAGKNLSADWDQKVLGDMLKLARTNLKIRENSINNSGAILSTPTAPTSASPAPQADPAPPAKRFTIITVK